MNIKTGIIGGAGYTGGELTRLLIRHPDTAVSFIHSRSNAGKPVYAVHQDLLGETEMLFSGNLQDDIDVLFICAGHGEAKKFLQSNSISPETRVIDLSQDFRLNTFSAIADRQFVYGLPELNRDKIRGAQNIANPGCFATAIILGLLPLAKEGMLGKVHSTGITGSTGAGQGFSDTSHFSWRANNIQAYKSLNHQHLNEINESLNALQGGGNFAVNFVPWRGDFTRGIFVSSQLESGESIDRLLDIYRDFYSGHPFTVVSDAPVFLKQVVNTNKAVIQLEKNGNMLVVHSALDNLLKGASGQAVQNMNLMFGLDECTGLNLKAAAF